MDHLRHINPSSLSDSLAVGYSQVIVAKPGKLVFIAGQVGWDEKGIMVGDTSFSVQASKALENVKIALSEAEATGSDLVQLKYFIVGLTRDRVENLSAAIKASNLFDYERPPTGAVVGVEKLARDEFLIEIEAIAVIPD